MADYPTLLFDADDVLLGLGPYWVEFLNTFYRMGVRYEDVTEWDIAKFFPGLTRAEVYGPLYTRGFWGCVPPTPGAMEYMNRLNDDGYDMYIVTATNLQTAAEKTARLMALFPFLKEEKIIILRNKQMLRGHLLVDDAPHNLEGGEYIKLLYTRPHNKSYVPARDTVIRVNSWEDVYKTITKIYPKGVVRNECDQT